MDEIQTFDLIGFKGNGIVSRVLSHFQTMALNKSHRNIDIQITHVGLAIRGEDIRNFPYLDKSILKNLIDPRRIYIFESNKLPRAIDRVPDVFGTFPLGVKLRPLDEIIANFKGHVYYSPHYFPVNKDMVNGFVEYILENNHVPYEKSVIVLMANVFRCFRSKILTDSVFCSELVAKVLIELNVLPVTVNPEYVVPLDFYINPHDPTCTFDIDKEIPILFKLPIELK